MYRLGVEHPAGPHALDAVQITLHGMANGMGGLAEVLEYQLHSIARDGQAAKEGKGGGKLPDKSHPLLKSVVWQLRLVGCLFRTSSRK